MTEDLLTSIRREMSERLRELRGAVDERDRLVVELRDLEATAHQDIPEPPVTPGLPTVSEPSVASQTRADAEPLAASQVPVVTPESPANVVRLPARRPSVRTRMVSPKVARLMRAPRRPALERSGVVRVGAAQPETKR